nr:multidrug resistance-associated protein 5 [Tanacetum cinerariifolium]
MKKAFQNMLHGLGKFNPTHAYYNGSYTSKDTKDPSWSTSFKTKRTQKTSSALEALWKTLLVLYLYLIGTLLDTLGLEMVVVNIENKDNWTWFLELLEEDMGCSRGNGLTLMSDQHKVLIEAVKDVMPNAEHRQCPRRIYENFRKQCPGLEFRQLFWAASKASYPQLFNKIMDKINSSNPNAHKFLMDRNPKSWSKAFSKVDRGCESIENGFSECFNGVIVNVRHKPLLTMLEAIRVIVLERMNKIREISMKWNPGFWHVIPAGGKLFEVRSGSEGFTVDEGKRTCSCRMWQLSGLPCVHATKVGRPKKKQPVDDFEDVDVVQRGPVRVEGASGTRGGVIGSRGRGGRGDGGSGGASGSIGRGAGGSGGASGLRGRGVGGSRGRGAGGTKRNLCQLLEHKKDKSQDEPEKTQAEPQLTQHEPEQTQVEDQVEQTEDQVEIDLTQVEQTQEQT